VCLPIRPKDDRGIAELMPGKGCIVEEEYKGYRLTSVFKQIDSSLKDEIITLWTAGMAVPPGEAERRVQEVAYIVRNPEGRLAGVSTVYLQKFMAEELPFYFMRMYIRPEDRGVFGLCKLVSRKTREFLAAFKQPDCSPKGVIIIIENPKYLRKGNIKSLEERGWKYFGQGPRGNHIWYDCFDGSLLARFHPETPDVKLPVSNS
jgi:hypothetical protein